MTKSTANGIVSRETVKEIFLLKENLIFTHLFRRGFHQEFKTHWTSQQVQGTKKTFFLLFKTLIRLGVELSEH